MGADGGARQHATRKKQALSEDGLRFIRRHEGFSSEVYTDSAGNPTIGWGHLIKRGEDFSKGITREQGDEILSKDVSDAVGAVNHRVKVDLSQHQFDALVTFTFNVGSGHLRDSELLRNLNSGKEVTQDNFTAFSRSGNQANILVGRRIEEFRLFSTGDYGFKH